MTDEGAAEEQHKAMEAGDPLLRTLQPNQQLVALDLSIAITKTIEADVHGLASELTKQSEGADTFPSHDQLVAAALEQTNRLIVEATQFLGEDTAGDLKAELDAGQIDEYEFFSHRHFLDALRTRMTRVISASYGRPAESEEPHIDSPPKSADNTYTGRTKVIQNPDDEELWKILGKPKEEES